MKYNELYFNLIRTLSRFFIRAGYGDGFHSSFQSNQ